jgi:hypothetical protein
LVRFEETDAPIFICRAVGHRRETISLLPPTFHSTTAKTVVNGVKMAAEIGKLAAKATPSQ